jgi:GAF domain-containing protein
MLLSLAAITTNVSLFALAASLWLGLYAVTRSRKSLRAWLAAAILWVLAAYFFQSSLALNVPANPFVWMRALIVFIVPFWIHLTYLFLPETRAHTGGTAVPKRADWMRWGIIPLGYFLALIIAGLGIFTGYLFGAQVDDPVYTSTRTSGPAYYLILPLLVLGFGISLWNLWRARALTPNPNLRAQFNVLLIATALEALAGALVASGTAFNLRIPFILPDLLYFAGVFLFGYTVARYNATLEGRPIDRDFLYTLLVVGSLTLFYCLVVWGLYLTGQVSFLSLALTVVGTVLANTLFDRLRLTLDRVFYQRQFQRLRSNLRGLAREAGAGQSLSERLNTILNSMCRFMRIKQGFIAVQRGDQFIVEASHDAHAVGHTFPHQTLAAAEIVGLVLPARKNLQAMKLLIPLYAKGQQIGAVALGERENATPYGEADLELLEDLADQIARVVHGAAAQEENASRLNDLVADFRARERALQLEVDRMLAERAAPAAQKGGEWDEEKLIPLVEDALRQLYDFAYLGEHPLGQLRLVQGHTARRDGAPATFLDRGKALSETLMEALNELRPDTPLPKGIQVPPREWHLYIILHDSYVQGETNRDTMSKLYISEGTFNRTRRRALRAVAKSLAELEAGMTAP